MKNCKILLKITSELGKSCIIGIAMRTWRAIWIEQLFRKVRLNRKQPVALDRLYAAQITIEKQWTNAEDQVLFTGKTIFAWNKNYMYIFMLPLLYFFLSV